MKHLEKLVSYVDHEIEMLTRQLEIWNNPEYRPTIRFDKTVVVSERTQRLGNLVFFKSRLAGLMFDKRCEDCNVQGIVAVNELLSLRKVLVNIVEMYLEITKAHTTYLVSVGRSKLVNDIQILTSFLDEGEMNENISQAPQECDLGGR